MLFCLGEGKYESKGIGYQKNYYIFNKPVSEEVYDKAINSQPEFNLPISVWKDKKDMSDEEIKQYLSCEQIGGYLKVLSYKDAWKVSWENASREFKQWVQDLPNFDKSIFQSITGIDIDVCDVVKDGEIIEVCIHGKKLKAKIIR